MEVNDAGAAFPTSHSPDYPHEVGGGLSIRDYFAAKALAGIINGSTNWASCEYKPKDGLTIIENDSRLAYQYADAMLKARQE